jgi:hypothetical protein
MNAEGFYGRYEVAVEGGLDLRVYRTFSRVSWLRELPKDLTPIPLAFSGRRFLWHPAEEGILSTVTTPIRTADPNYLQEREAVNRFLSALSFEFRQPVRIYTAAASGMKAEFDPPLLRQPRLNATIHPAPTQLEVQDSADLKLCLALMREGVSADSEALRLLSLFKAIEVAVGETLVDEWIDEHTSSLADVREIPPEGWSSHLREARNSAAPGGPYLSESVAKHLEDLCALSGRGPAGDGRVVLVDRTDLRGAARRTKASHVREPLGVDGLERLPLGGDVVFGEDRVHGAHRHARIAVNAFVGLDIEHPRPLVYAVDRTLAHARLVLHVDARLCDHIGHIFSIPTTPLPQTPGW